jgi:opacity protein-like surface antigen
MRNAARCRSPTDADQPRWWRASFLLAAVLAAAAGPGAARADSASEAIVIARGRQAVGLLSGYGWGHPLSGSREDALDTETVPIFPRWSIGLTDVFGEGHFYQGNLEFSVEGVFLIETQPHSGSAFGGAPGLRYNVLASKRVVPYAGVGAGLLDLDYDLRTQRDGFNFVLHAELGINTFLTERLALSTAARYLHISNARIRHPNKGIDMTFVLIGLTFFFL